MISSGEDIVSWVESLFDGNNNKDNYWPCPSGEKLAGYYDKNGNLVIKGCFDPTTNPNQLGSYRDVFCNTVTHWGKHLTNQECLDEWNGFLCGGKVHGCENYTIPPGCSLTFKFNPVSTFKPLIPVLKCPPGYTQPYDFCKPVYYKDRCNSNYPTEQQCNTFYTGLEGQSCLDELFYCSLEALGNGGGCPYELPEYCHYDISGGQFGSILCNPPPPPVVTNTVSKAPGTPVHGTKWVEEPDGRFCTIISNSRHCITQDQIDSTQCKGANISLKRCVLVVDPTDPNNPSKWKFIDSPMHLAGPTNNAKKTGRIGISTSA
jgi:hypothetical protein